MPNSNQSRRRPYNYRQVMEEWNRRHKERTSQEPLRLSPPHTLKRNPSSPLHVVPGDVYLPRHTALCLHLSQKGIKGCVCSTGNEREPVKGKINAPPKTRLPRVVHWRSNSGNWVVVAGPFPDNLARSETRDAPEKAAKALTDNVYARPGTTRDDQYAKVHISDILEIQSGKNEFGPVTP